MNIVLEIIIFNVVVFTICGINMAKKGRLGLIQEYPKAIQNRCRELGLIEEIIKDLCLLLIVSLHSLKAAHLLYPLEYLAADIDTVAGRSIVKRIGISLRLPLEHCGSCGVNVISDEVFTDYSDNNTGRANVLLNTAVDNAVLCYVYRL